MRILLIHQYFLEKEDGGGSRFNEMAKTWVQLGHKVTVVAGMVHYNTGKKQEKYKGKFIVKDNFDKNKIAKMAEEINILAYSANK